MKKTLSLIALLAFVSSLVLVGCENKQEVPKPEMPSTNAPAK